MRNRRRGCLRGTISDRGVLWLNCAWRRQITRPLNGKSHGKKKEDYSNLFKFWSSKIWIPNCAELNVYFSRHHTSHVCSRVASPRACLRLTWLVTARRIELWVWEVLGLVSCPDAHRWLPRVCSRFCIATCLLTSYVTGHGWNDRVVSMGNTEIGELPGYTHRWLRFTGIHRSDFAEQLNRLSISRGIHGQ